MKRTIINSLLFLIIVLISYCATQQFPPGGPADRTPPSIIKTVPKPDSLHVSQDIKVEFHFSENIDTRSVRDAVYISPNPGNTVKMEINRKKLDIIFQEPLLDNVTYTITLGTNIKDLRGNRLDQSYTLAFSTGDHLDRNKISGRVYSEESNEVTVWAYFLSQSGKVDPSEDQPHYITQCNATGEFHFSNLAPRYYRLFAVFDRNRNRFYEPGLDQIGLTSKDLNLTGEKSHIQNRFFRVMKEDTSALRVIQVDQEDRRHLRVRFSQPILPIPTEKTLQLRSKDGTPTNILDFHVHIDNPDIWSVTSAPRDTGKYDLKLFNCMDPHGRWIKDTLLFDFTSIEAPDTTAPYLQGVSPADSSQMVMPNQPISLQFSESLDTTNFESFFSLISDSIKVENVMYEWLDLTAVNIYPDSVWQGLRWYHFQLIPDLINDFADNKLRGDKLTFSWQIVDRDSLSSLSGRIDDEDRTAQGPIFLDLIQVKHNRIKKSIVLPDTGRYEFTNLLPGEYSVKGFRDEDRNGIYSMGRVLPFTPAERFFVGQDTILIRPRWPNERNNYQLYK